MEQQDSKSALLERRQKPRIHCTYPALVHGCNREGKKFEEYATVLNLSASGAYMVLNRSIIPGQDLSVKISMPTGSLESGTFKLATAAQVVRAEPLGGIVLGIAIKFQHYRFL
jgi:hypothetical protein